MAIQARCHKCKVHYRWAKDRPLKALACPECKGILARTSTMSSTRKSQEAGTNKYRRVVLTDAPMKE